MNKYNPNIDDLGSASDSDSISDSGSGSGSDSVGASGSGGPRFKYDPNEDQIDHVDALQHWASFLKHNAVKDMFPALGEPVAEIYPANEGGVGIFNTAINFEEKRLTHVVMVDSLDRDQKSYPLPTQLRLKLPRIYKNVERIDIVQVKFFCGLYAISSARYNNTIWFSDFRGLHKVVVPDGTYSLDGLLNAVATAMTTVSQLIYTVTFNVTTGRVQISCSDPFTLLYYTKAYPMYNQTAYTEWGLGWVLGWGGLPVDVSGTAVTADHFPRIIDDYIYLMLNDTERMNDVDHTYLEDVPTSQDSTGQVSHYFGKLLLNSFGSYAQTFIEAPKLFAPVLGRLDRLNFTWTDRHGNPLTGPDAASCDWHMSLRITEIVEVPAANSTLTQSLKNGAP
jgi:hypothetical protein